MSRQLNERSGGYFSSTNGIPGGVWRNRKKWLLGMAQASKLGDLKAVAKLKETNIPRRWLPMIDAGLRDVVAADSLLRADVQAGSLPLMFSRRPRKFIKVAGTIFFDPFEYLLLRHKAGLAAHRLSAKN